MMWRFTLDSAAYGPLVLADEPIGWADIVETFKRDKDWHGIFFDFSIALKYYGTGHNYLKNVYENIGIDEYVELLVEIACTDTDPFEEFYRGKLLMAKYREIIADDCTVEVPLDPAGCLMQLRNRIDQAVDLDANEDFDGNALTSYTGLGQDITLLPKAIVRRTHGQADGSNPCTNLTHNDTNGRQVLSGTGSQSMTDVAYFQLPYNLYDLAEINAVNALCCAYSSTAGGMANLFVCSEIGTYEFTYSLDVFLKSGAVFHTAGGPNTPDCWTGATQPEYYVFEDWKVEVQAYKNGTTLIYQNTLLNTTGSCTSNPASSAPWGKQNVFIASGNFTEACNPGDVISLGLEITIAGSWQRSLVFNNDIEFNHELTFSGVNDVTIKGVILNPATQCRTYLVNEALSRTVEAITNDCLRVYSDYFGREDAQPYTSASDGCGSLEVIFKGLHARQFPEVYMAVSFKDLFDALNAVHCIGIGLEPDPNRTGYDQLRIEPMDYWYDDALIILDCDNVPEIRRSAAPELYVSVFQFGYEKWEAEDSMGLDEFCTKREYRSTRREIKNTLERRCKFIGSGYAIEVTRNFYYTADSTKDWRWDNDIFLLCVRRDAGNLVVEQGVDCADTSTMTDIIDPPTVYNYRISPIRNLMRWSRYLFMTYFPDPIAAAAQFIFNSGEGNFLVKGKLLTGCIEEAAEIAENDTIDASSFADADHATPIFCPIYDEFDFPVSWKTVRAWRQNPSLLRGTIRYRHHGTVWIEGYIMKIDYRPNDGIATFTVLPKFQ